MRVTFYPAKRDLTLAHRGLDFGRVAEVFAGRTVTITDDRFDYSESRLITAGHLDGRLVVMVWTQRGDARHIISIEVLSCQRGKSLAPPYGGILMTRRS
jgi:hypothetical protein